MNNDNNFGTRTNDPLVQQRSQTRPNNVGQMPGNMQNQQGPPAIMDRYYLAGYLATLIGRNIRAEFLVGTNSFVDRTGMLREVGVNYFVLEDTLSRNRVVCDLYSVKFVTILS